MTVPLPDMTITIDSCTFRLSLEPENPSPNRNDKRIERGDLKTSSDGIQTCPLLILESQGGTYLYSLSIFSCLFSSSRRLRMKAVCSFGIFSMTATEIINALQQEFVGPLTDLI